MISKASNTAACVGRLGNSLLLTQAQDFIRDLCAVWPSRLAGVSDGGVSDGGVSRGPWPGASRARGTVWVSRPHR